MQRTNRSEEEKAALIARFEQGGTTAREFCREQGVAYQSFLAWLRKAGGQRARRRASPPPGFIELALPPPAAGAVAELDLGGGAVVRFFRCGARP